ncbi:MAG: DUF4156 domain-containing protein [Gammaproteobacteria bacterium]|nr:DUF4156 domain-containing protein [Gammaproteobacteria bacterium]MBA3732348.1 DUF4156 domain-containing protein [Gammaproteobacteria bacterium]
MRHEPISTFRNSSFEVSTLLNWFIKPAAAYVAISFILAGCQFVPLTPGGEKARVLSAAEVQQCTKLGDTTASVKGDILGLKRQESVVSAELERLARNNAAAMGGDTVVPASDIIQGTQLYNIYKCVPG